ncbi:MAG: hypothetical protein CVU41_19320 [Chloroflexi bacterium HGW-Chloroflexi-3]|nr:MAG: hypothetical protein CVU41_19320 [Chloroflexi bacterium HGW-Chloroflexi-3]
MNISNWVSVFKKDWKQILLALGFSTSILIITAVYTRTGWVYVFPINLRLIWLFIFTPFTALEFWIGIKETEKLPKHRGVPLAQELIGLFPLTCSFR